MKKGFTLIELTIVIAIIVVMIAVLLPEFVNFYNTMVDKINNMANDIKSLTDSFK